MPNFQAIKFPESIKINNVTITNLQTVLNTQKKSLAKSSWPKKYLLKFSYPQKSWDQIFQTPKTPSIIPVTWNPEYPPGLDTVQ